MPNDKLIKPIIAIAIGIAVIILLRMVFKRLVKKSDKIHMRFLGYLLNLVIVMAVTGNVVEELYPKLQLNSLLLKGSALVVAIVGFAAQTAISDLICGFLISFNKPFEIGDRIVVEGIQPGIVEDITLRHTVIRIYDDLRIVIPNSVLNTKTVINTSYHNDTRRGIHLKFSISYDSDVARAMDIIRDCVVASPYTLSVETNGIMEDSGPVYFLEYADSALILETTIWVTRDTSSYIAITDVNMRVNDAFNEYGIEIPYPFMNIVERENTQNSEVKASKKKTTPSKRHHRTDTIVIQPDGGNYDNVMNIVHSFAHRQNFSEQEERKLELMAEELVLIARSIVDDTKGKFWVEGSGTKYRLHLRFNATVGSKEYRKLMSLSSSGKNEAAKTLTEKIWDKMVAGIKSTDSQNGPEEYEWSLIESGGAGDDLGESILSAVADDIKVSVTKEQVDLIIIRTT